MKTKLELFSEKVAADCYGVAHNEMTEQNLGVDWPNITKLVEVIGQIVTQMMTNCPQPKALKSSVKAPTWGQRVRFRAAVQSHLDCCGNPSLKKFTGKLADACLANAAHMEETEVNAVVDEVLDTDNWLI